MSEYTTAVKEHVRKHNTYEETMYIVVEGYIMSTVVYSDLVKYNILLEFICALGETEYDKATDGILYWFDDYPSLLFDQLLGKNDMLLCEFFKKQAR